MQNCEKLIEIQFWSSHLLVSVGSDINHENGGFCSLTSHVYMRDFFLSFSFIKLNNKGNIFQIYEKIFFSINTREKKYL